MRPSAVYELPLSGSETPVTPSVSARNLGLYRGMLLPENLLIENVLWYCWLRWGVTVTLTAMGIVGIFAESNSSFTLRLRSDWPFVTAAILGIANLIFTLHGRWLRRAANPRSGVLLSLWTQIVVDLLVLTAVVHFVGSTTTFIAFLYLSHIVLSCIFFSRRHSLLVTLLAAVLYTGCIVAEYTGIVSPASVLPDATLGGAQSITPHLPIWHLALAVGIWLGVWYLAAHLTLLVRRQDSALVQTNARLRQAQRDRAHHMLRTTHELKAPFAAIHANTQLLLGHYCGEITQDAREVLQRIAARCQSLTTEIRDMLQLANLDSDIQQAEDASLMDLSEILQWTVEQAGPLARERRVTVTAEIDSCAVTGVEDPLKMLFQNLLTNAIMYSHPDRTVRIGCRRTDGRIMAWVCDEGIGVPEDKLPKIFDEHFRTKEAAQHNKQSSGLGLAIVRQVARQHRIHVTVQSRPGEGTAFELYFPAPGRAADESK